MRPHYSITAQPASEPVTYDEAAEHLRVDSDADKAYITALISVAREFVEGVTGRACIETQYKLTAQSWQAIAGTGRFIPIYRVPLLTVNAVSYYAPDSETLTSISDYRFAETLEPGMVQIIGNLPAVADRPDAIQIVFRAGYETAEAVRPMMKHAIKIMLSHLYENRAAVAPVELKDVPLSLKNIISNLKVGGWC